MTELKRNTHTKHKKKINELEGQLEILNHLVLDKDNFINSLIDRTGDQEAYIIAKEEHTKQLNAEISKMHSHIVAQEQLIADKDKSLEEVNKASESLLERIEQKARVEEILTEQLKSTKDTLEAVQRSEKATLVALDQQTLLTNDLKNIVQGTENTAYITAQKLIQSQTQEIDQLYKRLDLLERQYHSQNQWAINAVSHQEQLQNKLDSIHKSSSWRLTAPIRQTIKYAKTLLAKPHIVLTLPYRLITAVGWRLTPKLFHRIYHMPITRKMLRRSVYQPPTPEPNTPPANESTRIAEPETMHAQTSNVAAEKRWVLGARLDGQ